MSCTESLILPAGSDYAATVTVTDESGAALNLTGFTASIVDTTGDLGSAITSTIVTPAAGTVRLQAMWQGAWGTIRRRLGTARLALVSGAAENVSAPFTVEIAGTALRLVTPRGNDAAYRFTWPDDRDGASLTGETVDVINASATLAPLATIAVIDAASRECELRIEGDIATPLGDAGTLQVRRRTGSTNPRTLPPLAVSFR